MSTENVARLRVPIGCKESIQPKSSAAAGPGKGQFYAALLPHAWLRVNNSWPLGHNGETLPLSQGPPLSVLPMG